MTSVKKVRVGGFSPDCPGSKFDDSALSGPVFTGDERVKGDFDALADVGLVLKNFPAPYISAL